MKYPLILSDMVWSYSRISSFHMCPYKFFLTYIIPCEKSNMFFSDFGSLMHSKIADFLNGTAGREAVVSDYILNFRNSVPAKAPSAKIFVNYFSQGLNYLKNLEMPHEKIIGVEKRVEYSIGDYRFIGFIDLITQASNGALCITDHKSRALSPRSCGARYTKSDAELDSYLRQLYLYAIPVQRIFGSSPALLRFNCYRTGAVIEEAYSASAMESSQKWALQSIDAILNCSEWNADMEYYKCRYLCDVHNDCEFYTTQFSH